jgi:hypothetical protein
LPCSLASGIGRRQGSPDSGRRPRTLREVWDWVRVVRVGAVAGFVEP